ncbi:MAG: hypothetical protein M1819_001669 [Sarea resinae]|nr:MAG: hypothetical protein M1819_001669 [Sarea resinae]
MKDSLSPMSSPGRPGEKLFRCRARNCPSRYNCFASAAQLDSHYDNKHPDRSRKCMVAGCEFFGRNLSTVSARKTHYRSKHPDLAGEEITWYDCPVPGCSYRANRKGNLDKHLSGPHKIERPHPPPPARKRKPRSQSMYTGQELATTLHTAHPSQVFYATVPTSAPAENGNVYPTNTDEFAGTAGRADSEGYCGIGTFSPQRAPSSRSSYSELQPQPNFRPDISPPLTMADCPLLSNGPLDHPYLAYASRSDAGPVSEYYNLQQNLPSSPVSLGRTPTALALSSEQFQLPSSGQSDAAFDNSQMQSYF